MNRRAFVKFGATAVSLGIFGACAPARAVPHIGYLSQGPREAYADRIGAFLRGLSELGYVDSQNIRIDWRFTSSNESPAELSDLAADLVRLQVDVIVTDNSTVAALAAKHATSTIPVVFSGSTGPIEAGLVDNLAHPGGNVTGLANSVVGVEGMYIQLLSDMLPNLERVVEFVIPDNPALVAQYERLRTTGAAVGVRVDRVDIRSPDEMEAGFETPQFAQAQAMLAGPQALLAGVRVRYAQLAISHHLPSICTDRSLVQAGFLMCYGPDPLALHHRAAAYVDKILRGANPGDLPVEQPTEFQLIINAATAEALGLTISPSLSALVTEVIQ